MKNLSLTDVLERSLHISTDDVRPLVKYLDMSEDVLKRSPRDAAEKIAEQLRKTGSNDIATLFRGSGVEYDEIVVDVGEKLKVNAVKKGKSVADNESAILVKLFEDALDQMTEEEKRALFQSMGIKGYDIPLASTGTFIFQQLLAHYGGFATYRVSLIVANMVARALLGSGLTFATNAALTRTIGAMLGPIGWIATGVWLAVDIAGPAFRKTVPAVVHIAMLRQMLQRRVSIGLVGHGSTGKDAMLAAVFNLKGNVNPVAGSTAQAMKYEIGDKGNATVINYPGFGDFRASVAKETDDNLHRTDVFVMVVDIARGISGTELEILEKLKNFNLPILVCLNKVDLARSEADRASLRKAAMERLGAALKNYPPSNLKKGLSPFVETSFDPDPRLGLAKEGADKAHKWIVACLEEHGKAPEALPAFSEAAQA